MCVSNRIGKVWPHYCYRTVTLTSLRHYSQSWRIIRPAFKEHLHTHTLLSHESVYYLWKCASKKHCFLCQPSPIAILTANGSCTPNHVEDFRLRNVDIGDMKAVPLIYDVYSICASHMLNHIRELQYAALVFISLLTFLLPYFSRTHDVVYLKSDFQNSINQPHNLKNE